MNACGRRRYRWVWSSIDVLFLTWLGCSHQGTRHADSSPLAPLFSRVFKWRFPALCTVFVVFRRLSSPSRPRFQAPRSLEEGLCRSRTRTLRSYRTLLFHCIIFLPCCLSSSWGSLRARVSKFLCRGRDWSADRLQFPHRKGKSCRTWLLAPSLLPVVLLVPNRPQ